MKRRTVLQGAVAATGATAVTLPGMIPAKPVVRWIPWPGYDPAPRHTLEALAELFPEHVNHRLSAEATIDLSRRFWCHECRESLQVSFMQMHQLAQEGCHLHTGFRVAPGYDELRVKDLTADLAPYLVDRCKAFKQMELEPVPVPEGVVGEVVRALHGGKEWNRPVDYSQVRYLTIRCRMDYLTGHVAVADLKRFAQIVNWFADRMPINVGQADALGVRGFAIGKRFLDGTMLAPPVAMKLMVQQGEFHRGFMMWSLGSTYSPEELNWHIGGRVCVEEGEMPAALPVGWHPRPRASVEVL